YWGCSQGVGLFPGNFFPALLRGFRISLASEANLTFDWRSAEILSWSPQCGAGCIRCLFGLHHFHCGIFHGPSEGFGGSAVASSQWSSVHSALFGIRQLLSEVYQELLHDGQ
ncbi:unnamed protein product, partial [Staurois parvus]